MKSVIVAIAALFTAVSGFGKVRIGSADVVASTLILEAGGEKDPRAMAAVAEVIMNRAKAKNKTAEQICLAPLQFSCWNKKDISVTIRKAQKHPKWAEAMRIVSSSSSTSHTRGADHYHTLKVNPSWAKKLKKTTVIGNHIFYR